MCEPMTIAAVATSLAATGVSVGAAASRGTAAQNAAEINARQAERASADAINRGLLASSRARQRGGFLLGSQKAHQGASGALVGVGSADDVLETTGALTDEEADLIRNDAYREAYGLRTKSAAHRQQGEYARSEAINQEISSVIGGVGRAAALGAKSWLEMPADKPVWRTDDYWIEE